jgi:hypothetical protein
MGKRGGTEETLDAAHRMGVPVVWIDAHAPHAWQMLDAEQGMPKPKQSVRAVPTGTGDMNLVAQQIRGVLDLPSSPAGNLDANQSAIETRRNLRQYLAEHQIRWSWALLWKSFQNLVGNWKLRVISARIEPYEQAVVGDWPRDRSTPLAATVDALRPYYAWPDKLAAIYANRYRSAFVAVFLLAAGAVGMALIPYGFGFPEHGLAEAISTAAELAAIVTILSLIYLGRRGRWHEKWIDYRLAAELIRHLRVVAPLGGGRSFPQVPAHLATYGLPGGTWMVWYMRAVARDIGLPSVTVAGNYLLNCLADLNALLKSQIAYHHNNSELCHRIEHRLHVVGIVLLALTLVACGLHLLPAVWHEFPMPTWLPSHLLVFACGFFPALGAALAGINNQAEFRRIAKRSKAMAEHLEPLLARASRLQENIHTADQTQTFCPQAVVLATESARVLVNEVLDWRVVFLDRPLDPPA